MKALLKSISLILSLALVLGCIFTAIPVLAEDAAAGNDLVFNAVADYSVNNGNPNGVWSYQYRKAYEP
ncbi:MAG: hypothetical protein IKK24_00610, partial [Clostridia bacterium]|nr:hypothetical protein [Clostridia bacterium]